MPADGGTAAAVALLLLLLLMLLHCCLTPAVAFHNDAAVSLSDVIQHHGQSLQQLRHLATAGTAAQWAETI